MLAFVTVPMNTYANPPQPTSPAISIGMFAWNEEAGIARTLESLFRQSLFGRLAQEGMAAEVIVVLNGCTDKTAAVTEETFTRLRTSLPAAESLRCRVFDIPERGKINAWNQFVHSVSSPGAEVLFMMDADVEIHRPHTLWNMLQVLRTDPEAHVAIDQPCKHLAFKKRRTLRDSLSLSSAEMTLATEAQLCGQLYAIRSRVARAIYIPRDLAACEDGYLKALVCTDLIAHEVWPKRIRLAPDAAHTFEAYTSALAVLRNQKRQVIGQTMVHLLVDKHHQALSPNQRAALSQTIQQQETTNPDWLKKMVAAHLRDSRFCWRLYPGLLAQRFRPLHKLNLAKKLRCYPAAVAGTLATLVASWMAFRTLKSGCIHYWPKAQRTDSAPVRQADPRFQSI